MGGHRGALRIVLAVAAAGAGALGGAAGTTRSAAAPPVPPPAAAPAGAPAPPPAARGADAPPAPPPRVENAYWTDVKGDLPALVLEKAGLRLTVLWPDPGTFLSDRWSEDYGGTRFDHSGRIALAEFRGHTFIGRWTEIAGRRVPMYSLGTSEEYKATLAIDPAPPETQAVLRIGVGRMGRADPNGPWTVEPAPWEVQSGPDWAEFRQAVAHPSGWGYDLVKRLTLTDRPGEFRFDRRLRNTGARAIGATFYCHNWFGIDGVGIGPAYRVWFPFRPKMQWGKCRGGGQIVGHQANFLGPVTEPLPAFYARFDGRWEAGENRVTIEQTRSGAGVRIAGDWPVSLYGLYATREEICPEPHLAFRLAPGEERSWATTYTLVLAEPAAVASARRAAWDLALAAGGPNLAAPAGAALALAAGTGPAVLWPPAEEGPK